MMLLAYNHTRPTYTVSGGSLVTDAAALSDRSPASATRITWPTGTQTIATTCTITATFPEQSIGIVALLGCTLPSGMKVRLHGKRAEDAGYTYALGEDIQTLGPRLDGGTGSVWILPKSNDPILGLEIELYNDVGGLTYLGAGDAFDIGEIVISRAIRFPIGIDWSMDGRATSKLNRTLGSQVAWVQRSGYRVLNITPSIASQSDATDMQSLYAALRNDPWCMAIPTTALTQSASIYGIATRIPAQNGVRQALYEFDQLTVEEVPAS